MRERLTDAVKYRRAKAHLLSVHRRGYGDVKLALDAGVPMPLLVAVHDRWTIEDGDCGHEYSATNRAFQEVRRFVTDGGLPAHIERLLSATRAERVPDLKVFVGHVGHAKSHPGRWAKSRDWAEECLAYVEAGHYVGGGIWELLPLDLQQKYHPDTAQWTGLVRAASLYDVAVPDLAEYIPALRTRANDDLDVRGWGYVWEPIAHMLMEFGPGRTRLLMNAGLTFNEGIACEADDETLALMGALRAAS